ncbi:hypothetical protein CHS0354_015777 [Potamilus streckersoni]|uniref:EF-hand domain-containing protein n=1 Tax=Potamilus streckersoni TaxID=2493646 RepID=A0AAE0T3J3_9BIVA|nr:hypothetical protein CHS0354_015777 [Potamilus streckersoni]
MRHSTVHCKDWPCKQNMAKKLSDEQIAECREGFSLYSQGKNKVKTSDLAPLMHAMGQHCSESELKHIVTKLDSKGLGSFNFSHFLDFMATKMNGEDEDEELREAFRVFDIDRDGFITFCELRNIMSTLGLNLTDSEVQNMIREADKDLDGKISYEDFAGIMAVEENPKNEQ